MCDTPIQLYSHTVQIISALHNPQSAHTHIFSVHSHVTACMRTNSPNLSLSRAPDLLFRFSELYFRLRTATDADARAPARTLARARAHTIYYIDFFHSLARPLLCGTQRDSRVHTCCARAMRSFRGFLRSLCARSAAARCWKGHARNF